MRQGMEDRIMGYGEYIGVIYWDNGEENGNYYSILDYTIVVSISTLEVPGDS